MELNLSPVITRFLTITIKDISLDSSYSEKDFIFVMSINLPAEYYCRQKCQVLRSIALFHLFHRDPANIALWGNSFYEFLNFWAIMTFLSFSSQFYNYWKKLFLILISQQLIFRNTRRLATQIFATLYQYRVHPFYLYLSLSKILIFEKSTVNLINNENGSCQILSSFFRTSIIFYSNN